jgi:hypothetical protein
MKKYVYCLIVILLYINVAGQEIDGAFGIDVGYLITMGDWNSHPIFKEINLFNNNICYGAELEFKIWNAPIAVFFNYAKLSTSEYEDYVQDQGEYVSASASMMNLGGMFKYYALKTKNHFINVDLGMGYIGFSGEETNDYGNVKYDFIDNTSNFTIIIGLGYKFKLEENIAFSLSAREIINPGGVKYKGSGKGYDILVLPICFGIRYLF